MNIDSIISRQQSAYEPDYIISHTYMKDSMCYVLEIEHRLSNIRYTRAISVLSLERFDAQLIISHNISRIVDLIEDNIKHGT